MAPDSDIISVRLPRSSTKVADLGLRLVPFVAVVFTLGIIVLAELTPWRPPSSVAVSHASWIQPNSDPDAWTPSLLPEHLRSRSQHDRDLIQYIRDHMILRPSERGRLLKNPNKTDYSQYGQSTFYDNYLDQKVNGFYIEAGAFDGETYSDSLMFEIERLWDGILIEADPKVFKDLIKKRRHTYTLNACLSPTSRPIILNFTAAGILGGLTGLHKSDELPQKVHFIQVQCLPLYSIMAALGNRHVDILFLDIEGSEFGVLQSLPLNEMRIDIINAEVLLQTADGMRKKTELIETLLKPYGYHRLDTPFYIDIAMSRLNK